MGELEVVRSALRRAAKALDENLKTFTGSGSLSDVQSRGAVTAQQLGNWDAGQTLARTTDQAYQQLTRAYSDFMAEYRKVVPVLLEIADKYDDAEQKNLELILALTGKGPDPSGS